MRFINSRAKLKLTKEELEEVQTIIHSRVLNLSGREKAKILLEYYKGNTISNIAQKHNTNLPKIEHIIDNALQVGVIPSFRSNPVAKSSITQGKTVENSRNGLWGV